MGARPSRPRHARRAGIETLIRQRIEIHELRERLDTLQRASGRGDIALREEILAACVPLPSELRRSI